MHACMHLHIWAHAPDSARYLHGLFAKVGPQVLELGQLRKLHLSNPNAHRALELCMHEALIDTPSMSQEEAVAR